MKNTKTSIFLSRFLMAAFLIPLGQPEDWYPYQFVNLPPNQYKHTEHGLLIDVNQSASPLIYQFPKAVEVDQVLVEALVSGDLAKIPEDVTQGNRGYDDFVLRVGLILEGDQRLNWFQRQLAPAWLVSMEKRLTEGKGVDKVHFLTTCRQEKLLGKIRSHFLNSKLVEECITFIKRTGSFKLDKKWAGSKKILGLWIGSDGDDRKSRFEVLIKKIQINDRQKAS